jgi:GTPase
MAQEWNLGDKSPKLIKTSLEKAVLVSVITPNQNDEQAQEYLTELDFLARTAGAYVVQTFTQRMVQVNARTFIGTGKAEEIRLYVEENEIDMVIFDDDLSAKQSNALESIMKVKILDRTSLILDIFAERAQTAQAKTQVELAQMQYLLPRLRGLWTHLERQRGGIGMRGPGEKEIETDRRIVRDKIAVLKERLSKIDQQAQTQRKNRGELIRVALVGYTNVGKSTLLNAISKTDVLAENKLFATLDTTVRKVVLKNMPFLLSDTVGFIRKLPTHLVESFKSTLDEVRESDLLLHVVDLSHPQMEDQMKVVRNTLRDIGAGDKPVLYIFNKIDLYRENFFDAYLSEEERQVLEDDLKKVWTLNSNGYAVFTAATERENFEELRERLYQLVYDLYVERYPHQVKEW